MKIYRIEYVIDSDGYYVSQSFTAIDCEDIFTHHLISISINGYEEIFKKGLLTIYLDISYKDGGDKYNAMKKYLLEHLREEKLNNLGIWGYI